MKKNYETPISKTVRLAFSSMICGVGSDKIWKEGMGDAFMPKRRTQPF